MAGLPKITHATMVQSAERDVVAKAMDAVRKTIRLGKDDGESQPRLDRLISESLEADLQLQEACALLASLTGQSIEDEVN